MTRFPRSLLILFLVLGAIAGCSREKSADSEAPFRFVVYPGARSLPQLNAVTRDANRLLKPGQQDVSGTEIYDTDASLDQVAKFYADSYGYGSIAPDGGHGLGAVKPPAFRREGDLQTDQKAIEPLLQKLNLKTDVSKAAGTYEAVEIAAKTARPQVTIQRPYFDVTTSQVVNKTLILMSR